MYQMLFWSVLWGLLPLLFRGWEAYWDNIDRVAVSAVAVGVCVGINIRWLLPRFYFRKKYVSYGLLALGTLLVFTRIAGLITAYWSRPDWFVPPAGFPGRPPDLRGLGAAAPLLISLIGSALYELSLYGIQKEKETTLLKTEKLEAEIKFLKSQINPHFLFNTLNNIYSQTLLQSPAAPDNLLKLSNMLRYMIYDCTADRVPLGKELEYIRHYVDLFKLKDSTGLDIRLELDESKPRLPVAPLLFIPFIENAFKHGNLDREKGGQLDIRLTAAPERLVFEVKNRLPQSPLVKDAAGGIGLENVRRQLELIYPNRHQLTFREDEDWFEVRLIIETPE